MGIPINFLSFKNLLNKYNVLLFDAELRIAHFKYNEYIKSMPQLGGATLIKNKSLLIRIYQKKSCLLSHFINSLLSNNLNKINYIINSLDLTN